MRIVFFIVALLALAFWGFAAFSMWAVLTAWPPYAEQFGTGMFEWAQGFPLWRKAIWGASAGFGAIGSLLMLARSRKAGPLLGVALLLLVGGFGYDLAFQDGILKYGEEGVIASVALIVLAALFNGAAFANAVPARVISPKSKQSSAPPTPSAPARSAHGITEATSSEPDIAPLAVATEIETGPSPVEPQQLVSKPEAEPPTLTETNVVAFEASEPEIASEADATVPEVSAPKSEVTDALSPQQVDSETGAPNATLPEGKPPTG